MPDERDQTSEHPTIESTPRRTIAASGKLPEHEIVGESHAIRKVLERIQVVAGTDSSVLITGETGTGKELVARAIHRFSQRRDKPLIKVDCGALPIGLIESELFGHERGAFTGAVSTRVGRFELANGGTIFLDEVGDLPREAQAKLLRAIQQREIERVGGEKTIETDVRVIAATHRDLTNAVEANPFRQDLYYRLNVFQIHLPPLRERPEDIPLLAYHFLAKHAQHMRKAVQTISPEAMRRLMGHGWPGNVRELESAIERGLIFCQGSDLELSDELVSQPSGPDQFPTDPLITHGGQPATETDELSRLLEVLRQTGGNRSKAARILGIGRTTLWRKLKTDPSSRETGNGDGSRGRTAGDGWNMK